MNSIDLSLAPKEATHYTKETKTTNACWVDIKHSFSKYVTMSEVHHNKDSYIWQIGEFPSIELIELDIKPVYTESMSEDRKLPPVGSECLVRGDKSLNDSDYHKCKIVAHNIIEEDLDVAVFMVNNYNERPYYYSHSSYQHFKPLDTRTDTEKAIDYMQYAYGKGSDMGDVLSEIKKGYVHGVAWSGK